MKKTLLVALTAMTSTAASYAASIAVNFSENGSNQTFTGGELIGPTGIDSSNWNNTASVGDVSTGNFTAGNVINDSGATVSSATISWASPNTYYTGGAPVGTDAGKLVAGYLDDGGGGSNSFTLNNHGFAKYDLYVIVTGDGGNAGGGTGTFTHGGLIVNGVNHGPFTALGQNNGVLVEASGPTAGNYIKYTDLTGDLSVTTNSGAGRTPLGGFVIVAVPEPSSTALLGLGGLALILRRRK